VCRGAGWADRQGRGRDGLETVFDALVYADAALVGIWAGLGRHSKAVGFLGVGGTALVIAGLVLASLWHSISGPMGPGNDVWVTIWLLLFQLALATFCIAVVIAALLWLRQRGMELRQDLRSDTGGDLPAIRFSLRQLFLLMVVTGVLLRLGPVARVYFNDYRSYVSSVVVLVAGGVCLGSVGLAGLWAVFGGAPSAGRVAVACLVAAVLGLFPPYYFPELLSSNFLASIGITTMEAAIVILTLAVVRARGYRLLSSPQRRSR
jgi:MFS family permease